VVHHGFVRGGMGEKLFRSLYKGRRGRGKRLQHSFLGRAGLCVPQGGFLKKKGKRPSEIKRAGPVVGQGIHLFQRERGDHALGKGARKTPALVHNWGGVSRLGQYWQRGRYKPKERRYGKRIPG